MVLIVDSRTFIATKLPKQTFIRIRHSYVQDKTGTETEFFNAAVHCHE